MAFFAEQEEKKFFNLYGDTKYPKKPKHSFRKKYRAGGNQAPDFRLYYKATAIKTVWKWYKIRNTDQQNESSEIITYIDGQSIYNK